jgi:hypothetical protein
MFWINLDLGFSISWRSIKIWNRQSSLEPPLHKAGLLLRRNVYASRSDHVSASERGSFLSNRRSHTWPEPEAISNLAEGVWAPKEHTPLPAPDKSLDQSPDHTHSDSEHTESSIDEKLGIQRSRDASSDGTLKSRFLGSGLGRSVNSLVERGFGASRRAWGRFYTDRLGSAEIGGPLKLVHLAAVGVHLAVAVWALGFDPSWLPGGGTTDESTGWLRKSALVRRRKCSVRGLALLPVEPVPFCVVGLKQSQT